MLGCKKSSENSFSDLIKDYFKNLNSEGGVDGTVVGFENSHAIVDVGLKLAV